MWFWVLWVAAGTSVTPMEKVLTMLDKMIAACKQDGIRESALYNEYVQWCHQQEVEGRTVIAATEQKIADREAFIEEQKALQNSWKIDLEGIVRDISHEEKDLAEETALRTKEHQQFLNADSVLLESMAQLDAAVAELSKPISPEQLALLQQQLTAILEDKPASMKTFFAKLIQEPPGPLNLNQQQPEAVVYASKMSELLNLLKEVKHDAEQERQQLQKEEANAQHASQLRVQSMEMSLKSLNDAKTEKQQQLALSGEEQAVAEKELADARTLLASTYKYLDDTKLAYDAKNRQYQERSKSRADELTAINQAINILNSEEGRTAQKLEQRGKVQFSQNPRIGLAQPKEVLYSRGLDVPSPVVSFLQIRRHDPFGKVKKMIESMIVKLLDKASEEAERKRWCDEEMSQTKHQKDHHAHRIAKLTSRKKEIEADIATASSNTQLTMEALASMKKARTEATAMRQKEHSEAVHALKEYANSQQVLQKAIEVLQAYYEKNSGAFLQQPKTFEGDYTGSKDSAVGVIAVLEISLEDFARLESETKTDEATAAREYDAFLQECKMQEALGGVNLKNYADEQLKLQTAKVQTEQDLKEQQSELEAITQYWEKLTSQCDFSGPSLEERQERRQREIESLQNALGIITGEGIP